MTLMTGTIEICGHLNFKFGTKAKLWPKWKGKQTRNKVYIDTKVKDFNTQNIYMTK